MNFRRRSPKLKDATGRPPHHDAIEWSATSLLRGRRLTAGAQVGVSFLEGACEAAILTLLARLALVAVGTDNATVYVPGLRERSMPSAFGVLLFLVLLRLTFGLLSTYFINRIQFSMVGELRKQAVDSYANSSLRAQMMLDDGALQQLVVTLPSNISGQIASLLLSASQIIMMIAMLSYSMFTDALLTIGLIVAIVLATFIFTPIRKLIKQRSSRALREQQTLASKTAELGGLRFEVQAFGVGKQMAVPVHRVIQLETTLTERVGRLKGSLVPLYTTISYLAMLAALAFLAAADPANLAKTAPVLLVVLRSLSYGAAIQQAAAGVSGMKPSIELLAQRFDDLESTSFSWGHEPLSRFESCQFRSVEFSYAAGQTPALQDISFEIRRGQKVGLVGPSGGGKSTTARLMLGLLRADSGRVLVNGRDLHVHSRADWSNRIGVVPQSGQIMTGTIAENVRLFRSGISDENIWSALVLADIADEVRALPDGLETVIGSGQRTLSGGQTQRLAIARAFAGQPDFVLMDEPTSSIDAVSEASVSDAIERIPSDVTLMIISHRMRILRGCDLLVVIEGGRVTAVGHPQEVEQQSAYVRSLDANLAD
jgi:ATP-binding cassette subfamily B protein